MIDKSVETKPGHIVVAVLNGEMTLKRFENKAIGAISFNLYQSSQIQTYSAR